jgi:hypothetical protein
MSETKLASRGGSVSALEQTAEEHHQAIGGFLKMAEAAITSLRYTSYLNDREVGKALGKIVRAINEARPVLDRQRTRVLGGRAGGDAYFGDELDKLQKLAYAIETSRKIHQERIENERKLDRLLPLEDPDERQARRLELARADQSPLAAHVSQELHQTIGAVVTAARRQPQLIREDLSPIALKPPERHELLVAMLIENPDQPQATFVKECRVHPNTVRRTRQELEETGAIPFLAHRHAA